MLYDYYDGILGRIRSEVDSINAVFTHHGLKGQGNENVLRDLLSQFIARRFAVGTGIVIDHQGGVSRQCDIVIYDNQLYPSMLSVTSMHIYPIDLVYATIEVKTTLSSDETSDALKKLLSVRQLKIIDTPFKYFPSETAGISEGRISGGETLWIEHTPGWPVSGIFAYNSDARQIRTFRDWLTKDDGFKSLWGLAACLDQDVVPFNGGKTKIFTFPVLDEHGVALAAPEDADGHWAYEGRTYPVTKVDGHTIGVDQARLLMCYLWSLHQHICKLHINPGLDLMSAYFREQIRPVKIDEEERSTETGKDQ
jgi:hypothetical protein